MVQGKFPKCQRTGPGPHALPFYLSRDCRPEGRWIQFRTEAERVTDRPAISRAFSSRFLLQMMDMTQLGKYLTLLGVAIVVIGLIFWGLGKSGFRGLPGDIRVETKHVKVYFPIVTCIVLSVLLTLAAWLWTWFHRR